MKSIYRGVLAALVATLAMGAVGASAALAAPEWYSSATKPAPEWQQGKAKLTEAEATKSSGKIKLYDEGVPAEVECESSGAGTVGPGAVGKTTSWTLSACKATPKAINKKGEEKTNGCGTALKSEIKALPWRTELVIVEGSMHDAMSSEGTKHSGFTIQCETAGITITDECTVEKLDPSLNNTTGGVGETFYNENKFNCTLGGKEDGKLETGQLVEATKGVALEANLVEGAYSKLTSSVGVKGTGELQIEDKGFGRGVKCRFNTEGTVGAAGKGTVSSTTVEGGGCAAVGECGSVDEVQGINLPWNTELYESEGSIRDRIVNGGSGTPKWRFVCGVNRTEDECNLNVSPEILNGFEGGVFAVFSERLTKTNCKYDSKEGEGVWSGELKFTPTSGAIKAEK